MKLFAITKNKLSVARKTMNGFVSSRVLRVESIENIYPEIEKLAHPIKAETMSTCEILEMPVINSAMHFKNDLYQTPVYFSAILRNVNYNSSEGVLFNQGKVVVKESINSVKDVDLLKWSSFFLAKKYKISGIAIPLRSKSNEFYHSIFSNIPKLYALHYKPFNEFNKIKLLVQDSLTTLEKFYLDRILPDNVEVTYIRRKGIYSINECIFLPFLNQQFVGYLPSPYIDFLHSLIVPKRKSRKCNRILISRKLASVRRITNEDALFEKLKDYGFKRYFLEKMSLEEQIELFYDADVVVAMHGAGLANLIYSKNATVVEIFPNNRVKPTFYFLAKSCKNRYVYYCATKVWRTIGSDVEINIDEVFDLVKNNLN